MEGDDKENRKKEIVVLDIKRSQAVNIALTKLPPVRTLKQAILSMDSSVIDREGIDVSGGQTLRRQNTDETTRRRAATGVSMFIGSNLGVRPEMWRVWGIASFGFEMGYRFLGPGAILVRRIFKLRGIAESPLCTVGTVEYSDIFEFLVQIFTLHQRQLPLCWYSVLLSINRGFAARMFDDKKRIAAQGPAPQSSISLIPD